MNLLNFKVLFLGGLPARLTVILIGIICISAAVTRSQVYAPLDPEIDQIFFIQWVKRLHLSDHFLPELTEGANWFQALINDEDSFINIYLRQIYAAQQHVFTVVTVAWFYVWSFFFGVSINSQVVIGILTQAISAFVISMLPLFFRSKVSQESTDWEVLATALITSLLLASNGFMADFSATGQHNSGLLFLFLALTLTGFWIQGGIFYSSRGTILVILTIQTLAFYSFYTNVFILAPATFVALTLCAQLPMRRRFYHAAIYAILVIVMMVPAIALIVIEHINIIDIPVAASFLTVGSEVIVSFESIFANSGDRLVRWLRFHANILGGSIYGHGWAMLGMSIIGLGLLWKQRCWSLPLLVVIVHICASSFLNGFSYFQKTSGYIVPVFLLGVAFAMISSVSGLLAWLRGLDRRGWYGPWAIAVTLPLFVGHAISEVSTWDHYPRQNVMSKFVRKGLEFRALIADLDRRLYPGDLVIPDSYVVAHIFFAYSRRAGIDINVFRPLKTMLGKKEQGQLHTYLPRRNLYLPPVGSLALLIPSEVPITRTKRELLALSGPKALAFPKSLKLKSVGDPKIRTAPLPFNGLVLYRFVKSIQD